MAIICRSMETSPITWPFLVSAAAAASPSLIPTATASSPGQRHPWRGGSLRWCWDCWFFLAALPEPASTRSSDTVVHRHGDSENVQLRLGVHEPPLWAMLMAVLVASIPKLQELFFEEGSFINNSVTNAVKSSGGVAVPLILVVLGANLARNTMAHDDAHDPEEDQIGTKLLIASLLSRMVLPTVIMAPILAVTAKYLPISILDDPIFIVVCFLLTGAPSALQLAQICQINNVYEKTMGRLLFQSYVIWILPSTLVLVMMALEVVAWAT
ncbi:hypothetical protein ACCO45_010208 [Purpureocillium lilacinum]|uniref:Uncharacterized protein n=1 Tax=Purpureocillium lilacinum TaxID=33203 RepID=A0ACC4DE47_PURLI